MHMHMHASNHLLTLTNVRVTGRTLHQPRNLASPDSHSPACRAPQVFRPPLRCHQALPRRPLSRPVGRWRWLQVAVRTCRPLQATRAFGLLRACAQEAPPAARTAQGGRKVATLACGAVSGVQGERPRGEPHRSQVRLGAGRCRPACAH